MGNDYRRNHYIPVFYLKNFINPDNHFWVYDKQAPRKKNQFLYKSPKTICFEWDRNTFFFKNREPYKGLEKETYGMFDNIHGKIFDILSKSELGKPRWNEQIVGELDFFIPLLYWRSPISDEDFLSLLEETDILDKVGLRAVGENRKPLELDDAFKEEFKNDKNIQKVLRPTIAISIADKISSIDSDMRWRIIYHFKEPLITSDNPIIFENNLKHFDNFYSRIMLPLSNDKTLIRINANDRTANLHNRYAQDILTFHQAKRYVICSDRAFLEKVSNAYLEAKKHGFFDLFKKDIFGAYKF